MRMGGGRETQTYIDPQHVLGLVVDPRNPEDRRRRHSGTHVSDISGWPDLMPGQGDKVRGEGGRKEYNLH